MSYETKYTYYQKLTAKKKFKYVATGECTDNGFVGVDLDCGVTPDESEKFMESNSSDEPESEISKWYPVTDEGLTAGGLMTATANLSINIDSKRIPFNQTAIKVNGEFFIPMKPFFEALGYKVNYDTAKKTTVAKLGNNKFSIAKMQDDQTDDFTNGDYYIESGKGAFLEFGIQPIIVNDTLMVDPYTLAVLTRCTLKVDIKNNKVDYFTYGKNNCVYASAGKLIAGAPIKKGKLAISKYIYFAGYGMEACGRVWQDANTKLSKTLPVAKNVRIIIPEKNHLYEHFKITLKNGIVTQIEAIYEM